jgi:hypothetical protein
MVLTREERIGKLQHEVRILLHLIAKVDPVIFDYRPTPKSKTTKPARTTRALHGLGATRFRFHSSLIKREEKHHE